MNLQARTHRRLQRHRPGPSPARGALVLDVPPLLDYLSGHLGADRSAWHQDIEAAHSRLRQAAHELLTHGEPLRLGLRAGDLEDRFHWFLRLLELWPAADREQWLSAQIQESQRHAMAGSPLHDALDKRLFDAALPADLRLKLQALWLAVVAPGAFSLDASRREQERDQALVWLNEWLS